MAKKSKTVTLKLPRSSAIVKLSLFSNHMEEIRKLMHKGWASGYGHAHYGHWKAGKDLLIKQAAEELLSLKIKIK